MPLKKAANACHYGGGKATERLLKLAGVTDPTKKIILEIGCGTGRTACIMAERNGKVVAVDIDAKALIEACAAAVKQGISPKIDFIVADAHHLPFKDNSFEAVIAESVLAFCDITKVCNETFRVLKPGGTFGNNEITYLQPPDPVLKAMLRLVLGISSRREREWKAAYANAGFFDIQSWLSKIRLFGQFLKYTEIRSLLTGSGIKASAEGDFTVPVNRKVLMTVLKYRSYIGYGLYICTKPEKAGPQP
ncbi:MAG TPA: class I SAM-dependent methyltransferase [Methanocella sp.]|nr:class I SAM-dependent methyltransferase [Methanocella sp.]